MRWKTSISQNKDGGLQIRGQQLLTLIKDHSFTEAIFLLLKGKLPTKAEDAMVNALLVACVEHGVAAPSAFVPRVVASTGNDMNASLAAGVLTISKYHGGAIEACMNTLQQDAEPAEIVKSSLEKGERLSGFGHKVYTDADPRAQALFTKASELGLGVTYITKVQGIEAELASQKGKKLPINIDGAIAAILCELGFDARLGKAFFILGRLPGMMAHALEEMTNEKPYRRLDDEDIEYTG
ncbi:MAG: citryl-CoA lyase [Candidatus Harrisonbacteria bacterium CG10_big_fil_rev_8_21_14_0_10_49_15]|uniref:citrate synthase (unknown stereospecificity) n=1 Tax=Candidatus Harrisonbacteria bacterium CG10_big_fil_rev_8_21_14_0_10_49_15 TaxID=1974587 RepID=A0A2H0UM87_9BACT|nr:MAG: citryl-CoA lyase [Candidatus Harrisonbacteria bacterium CG10_big_fil_rev_8_21_14_0_10_49_15]